MLNYKNRNRVNIVSSCCFFIIAAFMLVSGAGCSKNGTAIEESFRTELSFLALTVDPARLGVKIDGEIKINDLAAPTDDARQVRIDYYNTEKKISIYDVVTEQVLFDSMFTLNTSTVSVSLFQKNSGDPLTLVGPPANYPAPPIGYSWVSIVYTFPNLPDEVKVVVQNGLGSGGAYEATDSFLLKKNEFSRRFQGKTGSEKPRLYFYTPDAERKLLAEVEQGQFTSLNTTYAIYAIRKHRTFINNVYSLLTQKLY